MKRSARTNRRRASSREGNAVSSCLTNIPTLLIAPCRHVSDLEDLDAQETVELMETLRESVRRLKQAYGPDGLNLGMNIGKVAGAGVEEHLHFHLLPRWNGDNNFMAVLAETRVISESLADTWRTLSPIFHQGKTT